LVSDSFLKRLALPVPAILTRKVLSLDRLDDLWNRTSAITGFGFDRFLTLLHIEKVCDPEDLKLIPRTGPAIVVANHPHGILDGMVIGSLLRQVRSDVKIISNTLLSFSPEFAEQFISVDVFGTPSAAASNSKALREAIRWLESGGMVVVFPSGSVSRFRYSDLEVTDPPWNPNFIGLAKRVSAKVIPLFISGSNRAPFHLASLVAECLGTAMLAREFLAQQGARISIGVGQPITTENLSRFEDRRTAADYVRFRTYLLANRNRKAKPAPTVSSSVTVDPIDMRLLNRDIGTLPDDANLLNTDDYSVYFARAQQIPNVLKEIGRLREISFRAEGEGTGFAIDLDRFDGYYRHLFVWHKTRQEIVGAYRMGLSDEIIPQQGVSGLYTTTLFRFPDAWWQTVTPAIELGRSFIRLEHQRNYGALLALWRGIGALLDRHPRYRYMFGPVSISGRYRTASKQLIATYLRTGVRTAVRPGSAITAHTPPHPDSKMKRAMERQPLHVLQLDDIDSMIKDIEPDRCGLPVLLRHYVNLGGRILAFNQDAHFASAVDGLLLIDLLNADVRRLDRFLGEGVVHKIAAEARKIHAAA